MNHDFGVEHDFCERCGVSRVAVVDALGPLACVRTPHTLDVHISRLRERFKEGAPFEIITIRGLGYKAVKRDV